MITQDELELFIDWLIELRCEDDSCPIYFGGNDDTK